MGWGPAAAYREGNSRPPSIARQEQRPLIRITAFTVHQAVAVVERQAGTIVGEIAQRCVGAAGQDHLAQIRHLAHHIQELRFAGAPLAVGPQIGEDTERFRRSLYVLIKKAVYDGKNTQGRHLNPVIKFGSDHFDQVTWASFNWDCLFEASFYYSSGPNSLARHNPNVVINLLNWRHSASCHTFLKLHGGINWWYEGGNIDKAILQDVPLS